MCAVGFVCAIVAEWAESGTALAVGILVAAVVALAALLVIKKTGGKRAAVD